KVALCPFDPLPSGEFHAARAMAKERSVAFRLVAPVADTATSRKGLIGVGPVCYPIELPATSVAERVMNLRLALAKAVKEEVNSKKGKPFFLDYLFRRELQLDRKSTRLNS